MQRSRGAGSAPVGEERVLLAHRPHAFRIDIGADHAFAVALGRGHRFAQRVEDHRVAHVGEPVAGAHPVHAHDVRLVLDRPGPEQRRPVRPPLARPVRDHDVAVGHGRERPELVGEAQVVANEERAANTVDIDREERVARPWNPDSEHIAYKNTLEQAIAGEAAGFHAFWTVEHHFLEEYSHCSNPEVLYGAIAARTTRMRLGYGVRLMPKPYNHPVRTAESVAVLDLLSDGRVDMGTGRSATRIELEGFGLDPKDTREMWHEAIEHVVECWTNERTSFQGKHWSLPERRVQPKPLQQPHPPIWGATTSDEGHQQVGELGLGLCSFAVGVSPEDVKR